VSELIRGVGVPLFDRLSQAETMEGSRLSTPQELEMSIARELSRLMNARSNLTLKAFAEEDLTVLNYGIPDFMALSAKSHTDMDRLQAGVARAVRWFEPRMKDVIVKAMPGVSGRAAKLAISGTVTIHMKPIPLSFELQLDTRHGGLAKAA
jgi:type VI secretion system protein ImpF